MIKDSFYPDYINDHGLIYTNDLNTIGAAIPLDNPSADPSSPYFIGCINTADITGFTPQELKVEIDSNDGKNSTIGCYEIESLKTVNWGYFYGQLEGMQSYYDTNRGYYVGSIKYVNSAEVYKWTINNANIVVHVAAGTFTDVTLDTGDAIKHTANNTSYGAAINISIDNFLKWHKGEYTPTVTLNGNTYSLQWNGTYNDRFWVFNDFYIWIDSVTIPHYGYYNGGSGYYLNPFISVPLHHPTLDTTVYKVWCCPGRLYFSSPPNRIHFNTALTNITFTGVGYHQYPDDNYTQGQVVTGFLPFETKGAVLDWQMNNANYGKLVMYNNAIFRWLGGSNPDYQVAAMPILRLNSIWTIFCLNNKYALDNTGNQAIDYNPHTSVSIFGGDDKPKSINEQVTTYPQIEPQLQDWQKYDHKIEENNYPVNSPLSLSLWSIKETKDDIKVANVFPYNHDAGDGTFFAQVRSKIKYDTLTRDENSEVIINGLKFEFEDAVRKSSWRDGAEEPEPYLLATYNFGQINSANFNNGENVIPKGGIQIENFPSEFDRIIDLKNNELIQGSYLGEVASYFDATDEKYDVWINISWKNRPSGYQGPGRLVIYDNNGTEEVSYNDFGPIAGYQVSLQKYDDEGKSITHTIKYQIYTYEGDIDNNWSVYVNNYKINYEDGIKTVGITNTYNKTNYYYDYGDHVLPVSKIFNDSDFINPSAFISYMKKLQVEAGKNPVKDWETYLKNQGEINNIKQNQVAFFLAKFTYSNEKFGGECFTIIPYLTIVIKENNDTSINTFEIIAKPPEYGDNPLANDMNENSQWSDENLIWPYYSKRNCDSQGHDQLGTASTKLFARKGCYIEGGLGHEWNDTNDDNVLSNYWETEVKTTTPYIGEPFGNNQIYYKIVDNNSINTVLSISQDFIPKLSNFCIFIIDNNMADAHDVLSIVPYYYKVEIIVPINPASQNKLGTMFATLVFNPKEENYWGTNPAPYKDTDIQSYKAHMVYETPGKFVIQGEDSKVYLVSQGTVRDGMVGKEGEEEEFPGVQDVKDWINPDNKKEIFIT